MTPFELFQYGIAGGAALLCLTSPWVLVDTVNIIRKRFVEKDNGQLVALQTRVAALEEKTRSDAKYFSRRLVEHEEKISKLESNGKSIPTV